MRIDESTVQLKAKHEASRSHTLETVTVRDFRQVFTALAETSEADQTAARERVQKMLQSLVDTILAAVNGRLGKEKFAVRDNTVPTASTSPAGIRELAWQTTTTETVTERERTMVCGQGRVLTSDGRQIDIEYGLDLQREFHRRQTLQESGTVVLRDPLILTFDGKSCELSQDKIKFDLDSDGVAEEIPGLGESSCFLVFDRNGNGRADNGSELFGAASGNGFADLMQLDHDRNGWIDEADPAYAQLAVWSGDQFAALSSRGVGALFTGAVDAPFSLKRESDNALIGQIRAAGLYLTEAGSVGHLQEVDLAVSTPLHGAQQPEERKQLTA